MKNAARYIVFAALVLVAAWLLFRNARPHEIAHMTAATDQTFAKAVLRTDRPALVYFTAIWCGTCHRLTPVLDGLAAEYKGRIKFVTIDYDHNPELVERYRVEAVPYLLLFRDGKAVDARVGAYPAQSLREWIEEYL